MANINHYRIKAATNTIKGIITDLEEDMGVRVSKVIIHRLSHKPGFVDEISINVEVPNEKN